jgi:uncharacterized protein YdhG (YjbR/CyaY superfamily)
MVSSEATTVAQYLKELPEDRREAIAAVREVILENLPDGCVETMAWGMISYDIPLEVSGPTYNKKPLMYAALASQKNHMAVYLSGIYSDPELLEWFTDAYKNTGKKMDVGKSCVRFKKLENLPLELVGQAIGQMTVEDFLEQHRAARG